MRLGLRIGNILLLMGAVAWLVSARDWEPAITTLAFLLALIYQETIAGNKNTFDHVYQTTHAYDFYNAIAKVYDARNSDFLLTTHRKVIEQITVTISGKSNWSVLDLAGGTGLLIAHQFTAEADGKWVCVDASPEMNAQFQHNMSNVQLSIDVYCEAVDDFLTHPKYKSQGPFDVAVLSLALSSMPSDPSWAQIARFIKSGGVLVIADIEPAYAALHPHFALSSNNQTHALATRRVHSADVINAVIAVPEFTHSNTHLVRKRNDTYSYVCVFERT